MTQIIWRYVLKLKNAYPATFEDALRAVATAKHYRFENPSIWLAAFICPFMKIDRGIGLNRLSRLKIPIRVRFLIANQDSISQTQFNKRSGILTAISTLPKSQFYADSLCVHVVTNCRKSYSGISHEELEKIITAAVQAK